MDRMKNNPEMKKLGAVMAPFHSVAVAYSGGVDSTLLVHLLQRVLGVRVRACLARTPFLHAREEKAARALAQRLGFDLTVVDVDLWALPAVKANPRDRCYHCKKAILGSLRSASGPVDAFLDGSHAGDLKEERPGRRALEERGVISPFAQAGWTKAHIRETARKLGLPNWDKPSQSCLATRVPHGTPLDPGILARIERAEETLWDLGCRQVRVRWHGGAARIQAAPQDLILLTGREMKTEVPEEFARLGFSGVSVDPIPYESP
ncbi:MAG: ATP-dependent sacrificial sulfur transferase LarE [Desulfacinum sp.]|nr:ATP-dependent sacrificial sulfur transferase LarE [Desulfacinum sp.]